MIRLLIIFCLFFISVEVHSQVRPKPSEKRKLIDQSTPKQDSSSHAIENIFRKIETSLAEATVNELASLFVEQLLLNIAGYEGGTYSSGQATSIVQSFFSTHKPVSFSFTRIGDSSQSPFGIGKLLVTHKGTRESLQVYVALSFQGSKWMVSQFNIY